MFKKIDAASVADYASAERPSPRYTILCFSHLRWDFVFQRPQQLMTRFADKSPVHYWEEPVFVPGDAAPRLDVRSAAPHVTIITPQLREGLSEAATNAALKRLVDTYVARIGGNIVRWHYTPMMLPFTRHIEAEAVVYDCMDELANFRFAPPELLTLEQELIDSADLVFTGGTSLYEAKQTRHSDVHLFPSSVDQPHFLRARSSVADPADQAGIARPRLGFYGVIDERFDLGLLAAVADARPDWSLVMVGPVVKIAPEELPQRANIHYLGGKSYPELPAYLGGWDVALMPFAMNESTRFISPTKTPEYLAGGRPVVSTPVHDVVRHYGQLEGVRIAGSADEFVAECEAALKLGTGDGEWLAEADELLAGTSWTTTQARMAALLDRAVAGGVAASATLVAAE